MVLCSFMLSNILRNGKSYVSEDEEAEFLYACRKFALSYAPETRRRSRRGRSRGIGRRDARRIGEKRSDVHVRGADVSHHAHVERVG